MPAESKLTPKQEQFCREYLIDLNATQAAIRAGYSEKTANEQGARLLANVSVSSTIAKLRADREQRTEITADWVLKEAAESYKFNKKPAVDALGNQIMTNAAAAAKFLELCGKHVNVKAFEKEQQQDDTSSKLADAVSDLISKLPN